MLSHLARTRAFKCLCALSFTVTHSHLCAGFLPSDAISCVVNNKIHLNRILLCTEKKSFIFLKIHNQVEFKHHMRPASPSLFLPDSPANTHNHAHSASTMRHYASLVVTLFSKSFLRPGCFLQTIPPLTLHSLSCSLPFFSSPMSKFKKPQSEFSKVVDELRHLSFEHGEPKPLQQWI